MAPIVVQKLHNIEDFIDKTPYRTLGVRQYLHDFQFQPGEYTKKLLDRIHVGLISNLKKQQSPGAGFE